LSNFSYSSQQVSQDARTNTEEKNIRTSQPIFRMDAIMSRKRPKCSAMLVARATRTTSSCSSARRLKGPMPLQPCSVRSTYFTTSNWPGVQVPAPVAPALAAPGFPAAAAAGAAEEDGSAAAGFGGLGAPSSRALFDDRDEEDEEARPLSSAAPLRRSLSVLGL
jgi:hypothetical protein